MATTNEVKALNAIIDAKKKAAYQTLADDDYFELFSFDQVLKSYDLSDPELFSGQTGGSDDGGIDGFFVLVNGDLLDEDTDLDSFKTRNPTLDVFIIQAKRAESFAEVPLDRLIATCQDIFDLDKAPDALSEAYNSNLVDKVALFTASFQALGILLPQVRVTVVYASKGDAKHLNTKVNNRIGNLRSLIAERVPGASVRIQLMGAAELLEAARTEKSYTVQLKFVEQMTRGADGYVALAKLSDYFLLVTDEDGNLRRYLFESNVRDYQGNVEVNTDIRASLEANDELDFWWLNNGITILASEAGTVGKAITLKDVQIVNGLQTTVEIYNYFKQTSTSGDDRALLVKVIITKDREEIDRVIKATNFQTSVSTASFWATDAVQRNIEDYFLQRGWYYDRRKNYYKNIGQPADRIITISYLAQALMAVFLREPNSSRARPTSLIKDEANYQRVFDPLRSLDAYLLAATLARRVDSYIRSTADGLLLQDKTNLRFHIMLAVAMSVTKGPEYTDAALLKAASKEVPDEVLARCTKSVVKMAQKFGDETDWQIDRISKSQGFMERIRKGAKTFIID